MARSAAPPALGFAALALAVISIPAAAQDSPAIRRVILSSSGLAHLEREARVTGDTTITMQVPLSQLDDLLKSLVVLDAKGSVDAVRIVGREPLSQTFRSLPFAQADLDSPVSLLKALRGAELDIAASRPIRGRLLGIDEENRTSKEGTATQVHRLSVLTANGIESVILEDAASVAFTDQALRARIGDALASVLQRRSQDSRAVDLVLRGQGERAVTLAYVVEAPIWKSAYRLVLPRMGKEARLQGWAVVENMSGSDWNDVELTLVSGNPVTLKQALYDSYYVRRPEIPVQVFGRVLPRRDQGSVPAPLSAASAGVAAAPAPRARQAETSLLRQEKAEPAAEFDLAAAHHAAASSEASTQVSFRFPTPLSVTAGQSLTVPFVDRPVPIERIWLYQPEANRRHPVAALKIVNDTGAGLPGGIVTIYGDDQGAFSGDAEFPVIPKDAERYVPFALDQKTLVDLAARHERKRVIASAADGILVANAVTIIETAYSMRAPQAEARRIIIEHPRQPGWEIDKGLNAEATPTHYRIAVDLNPGEAKTVSVKTSFAQPENHSIERMDLDVLAALVKEVGPNSPARGPLVELLELRRSLARAETRLQAIETAYKRDLEEQERVRKNLQAISSSGQLADAVRQYQQQLARLDGAIAQRVDQREGARQEIDSLKESVRAKSDVLRL